MLMLRCPFCGERPEIEFQCAGEAIARPVDPAALDASQWADSLYQRDNPAGWSAELWWHASGCRQWLRVERHTLTHAIRAVELASALAPHGRGEEST